MPVPVVGTSVNLVMFCWTKLDIRLGIITFELIILMSNNKSLSEIVVIICWVAVKLGISLKNITFDLFNMIEN